MSGIRRTKSVIWNNLISKYLNSNFGKSLEKLFESKQNNINQSVRFSVDSRFNFFGSEIQIKKNIKANLHFCNLSGDRKHTMLFYLKSYLYVMTGSAQKQNP
jgi:hypothetical protein